MVVCLIVRVWRKFVFCCLLVGWWLVCVCAVVVIIVTIVDSIVVMLLLLLSWFCFFSVGAIKNYFSYGAGARVGWLEGGCWKNCVWVVLVVPNISLPCSVMTTFVVNNWMVVRSAFVLIMVVFGDCCFVCCRCLVVGKCGEATEGTRRWCVVCNYWWWVKFHVALLQRWANNEREANDSCESANVQSWAKTFGRRDFHGRIKSFFCSWSTDAERSWDKESTAIFLLEAVVAVCPLSK